MKYKNYYKILGLSTTKVTDDEIKSAYRKLAKKYHPDRNQGNKDAAEKFKDINEAYQTLTDENLKRKYNRVHFVYAIKDGNYLKVLKDRIDKSGSNEFVEMFFGKRPIHKKVEKNIPITGENLESQLNITLMDAFNGVQKKVSFKTENDKMKTIDIKIPAGIVDGGKIRIRGQGKKGKNGAASGDLFIKINILKNDKYKLEKSNLVTELKVTPSEAALGCNLEVEGIDSKISFTIPAGIQSGEELFAPEKGYFDEKGNRGNLIARVKIVVPKQISEEEKKLYKKLQEITSFKPRMN